MRHRVAGRSFGRRPEGRKAMLRGLATSLLDHGRIQTTVEKAKELRRVVEPLITLGKRGDLHAYRLAAQYIYKREVILKLFGEVAPRFKDRTGGYTRIYRLGRRRGDGAEMAFIELLPAPKETKKQEKGTKVEKKSAKKEPSKKGKKPAAEGKPTKKKAA